jgi:hypothetical protein
MSTRISADGTRYIPRQMAGGTPETTLKRLRNEARNLLRSKLLTAREKNLVRSALAALDETSAAIGQAFKRDDPAAAARLDERRTEIISQLSLLLTQAQENTTNRPARAMTERPHPR